MGHLTRRSLVGSALAGGGALLAPRITPALGSGPAGQTFTVPLAGAEPQRAPAPFDLLGVQWDRPGNVHIQLRVRSRGGAWTRWVTAPAGEEHRPELGGRRGITDPVWTGHADAFQVRASRPLGGARVHLVAAQDDGGTARSAATRYAESGLEAGPGQPPIIARSSWATRACRPRHPAYYGVVRVAFVHHTVSANYYGASQSAAMVRSICLFHRNVHGWNDIGYNFLVDRFGQIFEGRAGGIDLDLAGAHAGGYNLDSTGIAMLGSFGSVAPSARATRALSELLAWKLALHGIEVPGRTIVQVSPYGSEYSRYRAGTRVSLDRVAGHRDGDTTECPGNVLYRRLPSVRRQVHGLQGAVSGLGVQVISAATLSGTLTSGGQPVPGGTVELQELTHTGAVTRASATTNLDGTWSGAVPVTRNATVRALYRGGPGLAAVVSQLLDVAVPPQITLQAQTQQAAVGIPVIFSGTVAPVKKRVTLVVSQLQLDGTWLQVRTIRVAVDDTGAFSRGVGFTSPGQYQVVATTDADAVSAAGASPPVAITVA